MPLPVLPSGAYTVTWRTVSLVDGHVAAGAFGFGVGSAAPVPSLPQSESPAPSLLYVVSRLLWYFGLAGLLAAATAEAVTRRQTIAWWRSQWGSCVLAAISVACLAVAQARDAGTSMGTLARTMLGRALVWRALPLAGVPVVFGVAARSQGARRYSSLVVGVLAAAAMLAHGMAGHAGAGGGPWRWWNVTVQWLHFTAVGAWMGAAAALWITMWTREEAHGAITIRGLSVRAAAGLAGVALTGALRTADEVGSWPALLGTEFGKLVLIKSALLILLALLGAAGRQMITRRPAGIRNALRSLVVVESVTLGAAFTVTAYLTGLPAPAATGPAAPPAIAVTGSDYATSVRVRLTVTPGRPGVNRFIVSVTDYDTRRAVVANRISLRFTKPDRPDIAPASVSLARAPDGSYQGQGSTLSLEGRWSVVALVQRGPASTEVPLQVSVRGVAGTVQTIQLPGAPLVYSIGLPNNRTLTLTLDPGTPGPNTLHGTLLDGQGREVPLARAPEITAGPSGASGRPLPVLQEGPGHFTADADIGPGDWRLDVLATTRTGEALHASLTLHL